MSTILSLLPHEPRRVASTNGGEFAAPCPFCGGRDRFRVWPDEGEAGRFWCRHCDRKGDAIALVRELRGLTFAEACEALGLHHKVKRSTGGRTSRSRNQRAAPRPAPADDATGRESAVPPRLLRPPDESWQRDAFAFVATAERALWGRAGERARTYLFGRALEEQTIRAARLGACRRGIVLPWFIDGALWAVRIRLWEPLDGQSRYVSRKGSKSGTSLYGADLIQAAQPAVIVEGEFDALAIRQAAGVVAVATGGTTSGRRLRWLARLATADPILVAFDADEAGEAAASYWLDALPDARRWRPYWNDPSAMLQAGADVRAWILAGLRSSGQFVHADV